METVQSILGFLNNPIVKGCMVLVGTFVMHKWPKILNEAAAWWTGIYSIGTALLGALIPASGGSTAMIHGHATVAAFTVAAVSGPWWSDILSVVIREGVLPWFGGYGAHRAVANSASFAKGVTIEKTALDDPIETKPFQTVLTTAQVRDLTKPAS